MESSTESDYQKQTSWRRLFVFTLIFLAMTAGDGPAGEASLSRVATLHPEQHG